MLREDLGCAYGMPIKFKASIVRIPVVCRLYQWQCRNIDDDGELATNWQFRFC